MGTKRKRRKGERRQGTCTYCCKEGPITNDHVFPQAIFLVLDAQMITVPACEACQQIKSLGDRDLRNFILMDIGGSQHPDAPEMVERMLRESNPRVRNWVRRMIESAREVELVTDTGIAVGSALEMDFNMERIVAAQEMVVRGLYFHEKGQRMPPEAPIDIQYIPWQAALNFAQRLSASTAVTTKAKGRNVAWWASMPVDGFPDDPAWLICYNDWVLFFGTSGDLATAVKGLREQHADGERPGLDALNAGPRRIVVPRDPSGRPMIPPQ
jgi:hypothetical protein